MRLRRGPKKTVDFGTITTAEATRQSSSSISRARMEQYSCDYIIPWSEIPIAAVLPKEPGSVVQALAQGKWRSICLNQHGEWFDVLMSKELTREDLRLFSKVRPYEDPLPPKQFSGNLIV